MRTVHEELQHNSDIAVFSQTSNTETLADVECFTPYLTILQPIYLQNLPKAVTLYTPKQAVHLNNI
jgi:hypothetical protein